MMAACNTYQLDPFDPRLPDYSEDGSDVAGCYFNGGIWTDFCQIGFFITDCASLIVLYDSVANQSSIAIRGEHTYDATGQLINEEVSIGFVFLNTKIRSMDDLAALGERIPLDGVNAYPTLTYSVTEGPLVCDSGTTNFEGNFFIHNVSQGPTPSESNLRILSGTFGFHLQTPCFEYKIEQGRYDYGGVFFDYKRQ